MFLHTATPVIHLNSCNSLIDSVERLLLYQAIDQNTVGTIPKTQKFCNRHYRRGSKKLHTTHIATHQNKNVFWRKLNPFWGREWAILILKTGGVISWTKYFLALHYSQILLTLACALLFSWEKQLVDQCLIRFKIYYNFHKMAHHFWE